MAVGPLVAAAACSRPPFMNLTRRHQRPCAGPATVHSPCRATHAPAKLLSPSIGRGLGAYADRGGFALVLALEGLMVQSCRVRLHEAHVPHRRLAHSGRGSLAGWAAWTWTIPDPFCHVTWLALVTQPQMQPTQRLRRWESGTPCARGYELAQPIEAPATEISIHPLNRSLNWGNDQLPPPQIPLDRHRWCQPA